jgi:hypothetical protein
MKTLREILHSLMVAVMQGDREEAYRIRRDLERYLKKASEQEIGHFLKTLEEVMEIWGWELEKASRLRRALQLFLDDEAKAWHTEEEGATEEGKIFYEYYHRKSFLL